VPEYVRETIRARKADRGRAKGSFKPCGGSVKLLPDVALAKTAP
jgi:hypothetical protein